MSWDILINFAILAGALFLLVKGSDWFVDSAEKIGLSLGVSPFIIGVTIVAFGTSLPELAASIAAVLNEESEIVTGVVIGSNITNPLVAIGGGALLSTYWVPRPLVAWDLPWETVTGAILWVILWFSKGRFGKKGAIYLMFLYAFYIFSRAMWFSSDVYM